jgi:hypothetical protein
MGKYKSELIEMLISAYDPKRFNTVREQILWERGFLTGILSKLMYEDSFVRSYVISAIKKKQK